MSVEGLGWESLLMTDAPATCRLKRALLTSYDRPDPRFLVEHLLPMLLRLERDADAEGIERQYFFGELTQRLEALHGELVVVASTSQTEELEPDYPWLWRFVRPLAVGREAKAVQHAKLWMLHWATDDGDQEYLELVISSANLTMPAFKGQIQGAWRVCLPLAARASVARRVGWGILPSFLEELATSCSAPQSFAPFLELLARTDCPPETHFVASVPGVHSRAVLRRTPWGAAGLSEIKLGGTRRVVVSVLAPYVGTWRATELARWCSTFGGKPADLELIWIDQDHRWARQWVLPAKTLTALEEAGSQLLELPDGPKGNDDAVRLHDEHRASDDRWSHAKAYQFRSGRAYRTLITSANFSPAAWGRADKAGDLTIENFELGVCVRTEPWRFADLATLDFDRAATVATPPRQATSNLAWAAATWDGKRVHVECRVTRADLDIVGEVRGADRRKAVEKWVYRTSDRLLRAGVAWIDAKTPPEVARLTCADEALEIPVFDARARAERRTTPVPEVDEDQAELMRDELLFEAYGGSATSDDGTPDGHGNEQASADPSAELSIDDPEAEDPGGTSVASESYTVATFEQARASLEIVDTWAARMASMADQSHAGRDAHLVEEDGVALLAAFERQAIRFATNSGSLALGPRLAAEELRLRLKHYKDEA